MRSLQEITIEGDANVEKCLIHVIPADLIITKEEIGLFYQ